MNGSDVLYRGRVVVVVLWLLCGAAVGGRRVVACCVSGALVLCWCLHSHCLVLRTTNQVNVFICSVKVSLMFVKNNFDKLFFLCVC